MTRRTFVAMLIAIGSCIASQSQEQDAARVVIEQLKIEYKLAIKAGNMKKAEYIKRLIAEQKRIIAMYD